VLAKWNIAPERKMKEYRHPAMFPEKLVERLLKLFSFKNDIVLDPFMGSGTTAVACIKTNRKYIGFEISEEYCKMAEKRIEPYLMQQTIMDKLEPEESEGLKC
jgi:DNA modification methylase